MVNYNWDWPNKVQNKDNPLGLVSPGLPSSDRLLSRLLRAQFEEWQKTFMPIELGQMRELSFNNPEILENALSEADKATTGAFGGMRETLETTNQALGIAPTENQAEGTRRLMGLEEALARAGAEQRARRGVREQDTALLLGGIPNQNVGKMA